MPESAYCPRVKGRGVYRPLPCYGKQEVKPVPFKKVVCWKQEMLPEVMDTEALQVKKHIFLATHHPVKMYRRQQMHGRFSDSAYDEASFLQDFLARPNFIFVPILGNSGTGKPTSALASPIFQKQKHGVSC